MSWLPTRLAGAPISWGVCEVPGWGQRLAPPRVLGEMASLGLTATELGPAGYLGEDPGQVTALLAGFGLSLAGAFVPLVLHDEGQRGRAVATATAAVEMLKTGGGRFVTALVTDEAWSPPRPLEPAQWRTLFDGLDLIDQLCLAHGVIQVVHPHVGTLVESADEVRRTLEGSGAKWCLDTGHLALGGVDPATFAAEHGDRVGHVHLKDVSHQTATDLHRGLLTFVAAVQDGLFCPLGDGDVNIAAVVAELEGAGYQGWYVLEQDVALTGATPAEGQGPIEDVRRSIQYLDGLSPP